MLHRFTAFGGSSCEIAVTEATTGWELSAAVADVYAFEERLSRFRPGSELSSLNAAAGRRVSVSPLCEALLRAALEAHERTGGLVNAAVLPQLVAAGYDATIETVRRRDAGGVPAATGRSQVPGPAPALPDVLEVGAGWARLRPACALDLGGIAKGWLADRLAERLENAVVNLGGDLRAAGAGPQGRGWSVEVCDGRRLAARDAGVATSGTSGRRWRGGHHLIDPRSGRPASTDVAAVSVAAGDAATAEALATAAAILGSAAGTAFARARGALAVAVVTVDPAAPEAAAS